MKFTVAVLFAFVAFAVAEKKHEKRGIIDVEHGHSDLHLAPADLGYHGLSYAHAAPLSVAAPIHHDFGLHGVHAAPVIAKTPIIAAHAHAVPAVAKSYSSLTFGTAPVIAKAYAAPVYAAPAIHKTILPAPVVTKSFIPEPHYAGPIVSAHAAPVISAHHGYEHEHLLHAPLVTKAYSAPIIAKSYAAPIVTGHAYEAPLALHHGHHEAPLALHHGHHEAYGLSLDGHYAHHH